MGRCSKGPAIKGSQYQLQLLVNDPADPLGSYLRHSLALEAGESIHWTSPLESDGFAEYQDASFLEHVGLPSEKLLVPLQAFWPTGGPCWDALARTDNNRVVLVEAKSHIGELRSNTRATGTSLTAIRRALEQAQVHYGGSPACDWAADYYQYCNRLAHLYWLSVLNKVDTFLVFVYFANDKTMTNPVSAERWKSAIRAVHDHLGLTSGQLGGRVQSLIVDADRQPVRIETAY